MNTISCPEMTSDLVRGWLDDRLETAHAAAVKQHLRTCPSCFKSLMSTVSQNLFSVLRSGDSARLSSFMEQVSNELKTEPSKSTVGGTVPLSARLQELLATTRDILWPRWLTGIPAMATLSGDEGVNLQEVNEAGQAVGTPLFVSEDHVTQGPVLTKQGRFQFRLNGTQPQWIGRRLICTIQLIEKTQTISLQTAMVPSAATTGWEAVFDEGLLTDPATLSDREYRVPFNQLKLVVEPCATTLQG